MKMVSRILIAIGIFLSISAGHEQTADGSSVAMARFTCDAQRPYRVHRIEIVGNTCAREAEVRRVLLVREGAPYDENVLKHSVSRINQLGRFEPIDLDSVDIRVNDRDVTVDITIRLKCVRKNNPG